MDLQIAILFCNMVTHYILDKNITFLTKNILGTNTIWFESVNGEFKPFFKLKKSWINLFLFQTVIHFNKIYFNTYYE